MQQTRSHDRITVERNEAGVADMMRDELNDEIDLRRYVEILLKRKKLVLSVFFTAVFSAVVWSILSPKVYEVSAIIGPPIMAVTDAGVQEFDSIGNIKAEIETGAFNAKIINDLNVPRGGLKFDVSQPRDAKLIKVSLIRTEEQSELGKKTLAKLIEMLSLNYAGYIQDKRDRIENQIKMIRSQIGRKENEMKAQNEQVEILAEREKQYSDDIREAKTNSEKLAENRTALIERKENKDDISALLYVATIQQNISYFTQLQSELSSIRIQKENILSSIKNLSNGINEDRIGIENMKLSANAMSNIVVIQEPLVSMQPVGPQKKKNIATAGFVGLVAGFLAAAVAEYWANSQRNS